MDSSNLQETLNGIDAAIEKYQAQIELGEALDRMKQTKDFKLVFEEYYVKTHSQELFNILTDPTGESRYSPDEIHLMLAAISHFKREVGTEGYVGTINSDAEGAKGYLDREREFRKEVTASAARG